MSEEEVAGGGMARKRHMLAIIEMRGRRRGSRGSGKKFEATEGVSQKRDTPIISLLEQGRDLLCSKRETTGLGNKNRARGR